MRWSRGKRSGLLTEWGRRGTVAAAALGCALLGLGGPPAAAPAPLEGVGSLTKPSSDPAMIRPNLTRSIALQRRAMEQLHGPQDPENLKAIAQLLHDAYVLTRASHTAVIHMRRQRESHGSVDPLLKMQDQTLSASRSHILRASHGLKDGIVERLEKVNRRIENLEEAIRNIQRVLGTVP